MLGKIFNKVKAAIPQMIAKVNAVAGAISAVMGKTSGKIEDTSDSRREMLLKAFKKGDSLERGTVTTGAIKLNTMDVFDYVKFFTELEALPRQVEQPRQAYTQEQYEKDMAEYRKEKLMTDITLGLMSPFIAAEQIVRGFGEGAGALMAFPVETIQEVGSGIVQLDPSKNIITAPLYGVVTQTGPLLTRKLTPEELVQYQVDLFAVGTSAYGAANTASNLGSRADSFIKKRTTAQSVATPSGSGVRISDAVDDIGIQSLDDIAKEISEGVSKADLLPNVEKATIDPKKLTEYALNPEHPVGGNKAKVFQSALGYNQSNADDLLRQIQKQLPNSKAILGKADQYGQRYTIDMSILGPNGKKATVRTGWIIKQGATNPELITLYVN